METLKTDILVVGAGPAGSTAARYAAEKGVNVTLIERRREIGVPVRCGEFLPCIDEIKSMFPKAMDIEETFELPTEQKIRETEGIRLVNPKGKVTEIPFVGFTIDRDRYDKYKAQQAVKAGSELIKECRFDGIKNGIAVTSKGNIEYKVIIGADGPGSRVAKNLKLQKNRNPYPALTGQAKGDFDPYMIMSFGDVAPGAYGWIIPKKGQANVGIGISPKFAKGSLLQYFDIYAKKNNFDIINAPKGKFVPSEGPISNTVSGNGMIVGDAAGQVISVNGGGIPLALIAGRICGEVAASNIIKSRPLDDYQKMWHNIMLKQLRIAAFNKKLADIFAFSGSERRIAMCMGILGKRRMGNLIRCKHIFP